MVEPLQRQSHTRHSSARSDWTRVAGMMKTLLYRQPPPASRSGWRRGCHFSSSIHLELCLWPRPPAGSTPPRGSVRGVKCALRSVKRIRRAFGVTRCLRWHAAPLAPLRLCRRRLALRATATPRCDGQAPSRPSTSPSKGQGRAARCCQRWPRRTACTRRPRRRRRSATRCLRVERAAHRRVHRLLLPVRVAIAFLICFLSAVPLRVSS